MEVKIKGTTYIVINTFANIKSLKEIVINQLIDLIKKGQNYDKQYLPSRDLL